MIARKVRGVHMDFSPFSTVVAIVAISVGAGVLNNYFKMKQMTRGNADQDIGKTVSSINQQLQLIGNLNLQIQQATAASQPTGDLEDQRNAALQAVASDIDVNYFTVSATKLKSSSIITIKSYILFTSASGVYGGLRAFTAARAPSTNKKSSINV